MTAAPDLLVAAQNGEKALNWIVGNIAPHLWPPELSDMAVVRATIAKATKEQTQ